MNFWHNIDRPIIGLSPMDGVTDASFRFVTAKHGGPDVTFTEFVNVQSAHYAPHTLFRDFLYSEIERPVVAQVYGKDPELFYQAAHIVCALGFDGLDINMGCPAKSVAASGSGAALIRTPDRARAILRAAAQGIRDWADGQTLSDLGLPGETVARVATANRLRTGTDSFAPRQPIPLSVKTRLGYDRIVVDDWIPILLEEKPAAISLHGRTLLQGYKGDADWDAIARAVKIAEGCETLVLGNGDLRDLHGACRRICETNVDGVLLGRAAQGNPWIFRTKNEVKKAIRSGANGLNRVLTIDSAERFDVMLEHSRDYENRTQLRNFLGMRKHLIWYCREFRGAAEMRRRMARANNADEVAEWLECYREIIASPARFAASDGNVDGAAHLEKRRQGNVQGSRFKVQSVSDLEPLEH